MSFLTDAVGSKYSKVSSKNSQGKLHLIKKENYQQTTEKMNNILMIKIYVCSSSHSIVTFDYLCVENTVFKYTQELVFMHTVLGTEAVK